jgi:hypothetical protein
MSGWSAAAWAAAAAGRPGVGAGIAGTATALLARRLAPVTAGAWPLAGRLAAGGTLAAGRVLGSTLSRAWWPVAVPAAVAVRRLRVPLAVLVLAPPALGWLERRPPMNPASYVAARLLDDVAYSIGVWKGCLTHRTARPLAPRLTWRRDPYPRLRSASSAKMPPWTGRAWNPTCWPVIVSYRSLNGTRLGVVLA